jgi:hypothetical protein
MSMSNCPIPPIPQADSKGRPYYIRQPYPCTDVRSQTNERIAYSRATPLRVAWGWVGVALSFRSQRLCLLPTALSIHRYQVSDS